MDEPIPVSVAVMPEFDRRMKDAKMRESELDDVIDILAINPQAGTQRGDYLYKLRHERPGMGKRGGYRVVYFFKCRGSPICLLTVFTKAAKADLTPKEWRELEKLADELAVVYGEKA